MATSVRSLHGGVGPSASAHRRWSSRALWERPGDAKALRVVRNGRGVGTAAAFDADAERAIVEVGFAGRGEAGDPRAGEAEGEPQPPQVGRECGPDLPELAYRATSSRQSTDPFSRAR